MESIVALPFQDEIVQVCAPPMRGTNAAVIGQGTQPTAVFTYWRGTIMSPHTSHSSNHVKHAASSSQVPDKSHRGNARAACDADIAKRAYEKYEARPILAVKAMRAAAGLVLFVSTLGDIGIASGPRTNARRILRDVRSTGRVLDMVGRMGCML